MKVGWTRCVTAAEVMLVETVRAVAVGGAGVVFGHALTAHGLLTR